MVHANRLLRGVQEESEEVSDERGSGWFFPDGELKWE
jgi:hypothetical protein